MTVSFRIMIALAALPSLLACDDDDCSSVDDRVDELLSAAQVCDSDDDCMLATLSDGCVAELLCSVPVRKSADIASLRMEARDIDQTSQECKQPCANANCAPSDVLTVRCVDRQCSITPPATDGGQ